MTRFPECRDGRLPSRRALLGGAAATLSLWGLVPARAVAAGRDPRLLVVILRGALDGIAMIAPVGDPDYRELRGPLALALDGPTPAMQLDTLFALNHAMPYLASRFQAREALGLHAVATPYRARSHFDGQDVLESGLGGTGRIDDGWLNRALSTVPGLGVAAPQKGLAIGAVVPLVMRGRAPVLSWIPPTSGLPLRASTIERLAHLYATTDPKLGEALAGGVAIEHVAGGAPIAVAKAAARTPGSLAPPKPAAPPQARPFQEFIDTASAAARLMAAADGPRIGAISYNGWDTHANEGAVQGMLANRLGGLDLAIRTFAEGMGAAWKETAVVVVTEFGRTARANGTGGTDHGTGTLALLVGGAVRGGRVIADWPGLKAAALYEGRDLKPTTDLRAVLKGVLRDHLGVAEARLAADVFPDSAAVRPMAGLIA